MPVRFDIRITLKDGETTACTGTIGDEDWKLFREFRDYATELEPAEWVRSGLDSSYSIHANANGEATVDAPNRPSNAAVRELLHLMRPFVLRSEPTWYPNINSRLRLCLDHPSLREWLAVGRRIFDHGRFHLYGQITINDLPLHDERTFTQWLNAFEYHRDPAKRAKLNAALNGPPDELALAAFRSILADRAVEVLRLAAFITSIEQAPSNAQR